MSMLYCFVDVMFYIGCTWGGCELSICCLLGSESLRCDWSVAARKSEICASDCLCVFLDIS